MRQQAVRGLSAGRTCLGFLMRQRGTSRRTSQRIFPFKEWCALNSISEATGRRLIKAGKVRVTRLSERRIGIAEDDNVAYQARCAQGGA